MMPGAKGRARRASLPQSQWEGGGRPGLPGRAGTRERGRRIA